MTVNPYFGVVFRTTLKQVSIEDESAINKVHKFSYLIGQLKGEALQLLDGFSSDASSYDEAIELLKSNYGKARIIIKSHLYSIFDLKSSTYNSKDLSSFRAAYESFEKLKNFKCKC